MPAPSHRRVCNFFTLIIKCVRRRSPHFIQRKISQNPLRAQIRPADCRLYLYMKKILLLSVALLGVVSVSQAGVRFNFGFGLPLPTPPIIAAPAPPAYVAPAPGYSYPGQCYDYSAPCYGYSAPYYGYSPYVAPPVFGFGYGDRDDHPHWGGGHWDGHRDGGFRGGFHGGSRGGFAHRR